MSSLPDHKLSSAFILSLQGLTQWLLCKKASKIVYTTEKSQVSILWAFSEPLFKRWRTETPLALVTHSFHTCVIDHLCAGPGTCANGSSVNHIGLASSQSSLMV